MLRPERTWKGAGPVACIFASTPSPAILSKPSDGSGSPAGGERGKTPHPLTLPCPPASLLWLCRGSDNNDLLSLNRLLQTYRRHGHQQRPPRKSLVPCRDPAGTWHVPERARAGPDQSLRGLERARGWRGCWPSPRAQMQAWDGGKHTVPSSGLSSVPGPSCHRLS